MAPIRSVKLERVLAPRLKRVVLDRLPATTLRATILRRPVLVQTAVPTSALSGNHDFTVGSLSVPSASSSTSATQDTPPPAPQSSIAQLNMQDAVANVSVPLPTSFTLELPQTISASSSASTARLSLGPALQAGTVQVHVQDAAATVVMPPPVEASRPGLVPKPAGRLGLPRQIGYDLQEEMRGVRSSEFKLFQLRIYSLCARHLDIAKSWGEQTHGDINEVVRQALRSRGLAKLANFEHHWATIDLMIQQFTKIRGEAKHRQ